MTKACSPRRARRSNGPTAKGVEKKIETPVTTPKGVDPFASHGRLFEQGKADMYNACEWGNYCRVQDTGQGSRQLGRRAIVTYAAIVVRPDSPVYTPQQLANNDRRAVLFRHPLHRAAPARRFLAARVDQALQRAERLALSPRRDDARRNRRDHAHRAHITLAEKKGCRIVCSAFYHGTEVASDRVDAETYAAFNRAVREAVRRINANKKAYLHYFIDYHAKKDPEIAALKVEDLRESRLVVCDPAPIPADEMQRTTTG